jgi:hypothetical protein
MSSSCRFTCSLIILEGLWSLIEIYLWLELKHYRSSHRKIKWLQEKELKARRWTKRKGEKIQLDILMHCPVWRSHVTPDSGIHVNCESGALHSACGFHPPGGDCCGRIGLYGGWTGSCGWVGWCGWIICANTDAPIETIETDTITVSTKGITQICLLIILL